eukprot:INCI19732.1.p1 GENE.INCI19732.1~~INCI19732.1.p1  ORF type:complete len:450 (-),score=48.28 INCI19732.1:16-1365(-)
MLLGRHFLRRWVTLLLVSCVLPAALSSPDEQEASSSVFNRDVVVVGGTSGSGTRAFAVLLAQLGIDMVYEHHTSRGHPPFDAPSLAYLEPAKLLAEELARKGGDICATSGHSSEPVKKRIFEELFRLSGQGNISGSKTLGKLRYVHQWLHSQAGAAAARAAQASSPSSAGADFLRQHGHRALRSSVLSRMQTNRHSANSSNPLGFYDQSTSSVGRRALKAHINAPFPAGVALKEVRDAFASLDNNRTGYGPNGVRFRSPLGAAKEHAESLWPKIDEVQYCHDITNSSCPWGFKSPASLLSLGEYSRLFGKHLHFVHVVRDVRDMLEPRSHSFIQTRKFYDALFPQTNSSADSCTMLAHGDKNAFEAVLRAGSNARSRCSEQQMEQLRTVRLWAKTNLKAHSCAAKLGFSYYIFRIEDFVFGSGDSVEGVPQNLLKLLADLGTLAHHGKL